MAYILDRVIMMDSTRSIDLGDKDATSPLARYLENGNPLTPVLREWLVELLKCKGPYKLKFTKHRGRRKSTNDHKRDNLAAERAEQLTGRTITKPLCRELYVSTGMSDALPEERGTHTIYRFGWNQRDDFGGYVRVSLTLRTGKTLNTLQINTIVAAEFDISLSTVKRIRKNRVVETQN
jgi:hypothetical protein